MARLIVTPATFPGALRRKLKDQQRLVERAALGAAHRGLAEAVKLADEKGLVDQGGYKAGFDVRRVPGLGGELVNNSPHAGVIEHGRRPRRPGPPLAPILGWVKRKLGLVEPEASRAAWAIRRAIHERGTKPHHIMRTTFRKMQGWFREDIRVAMDRGIDLLAKR